MICGIYRLIFSGTEKVYIGQSVNIEKRYNQHLCSIKNNTANYKLIEAFKLYGNPQLDILVVCIKEELDNEEEQSIQIFDSVNNGFNIYTYSNQAPIGYGTEAPNSRYAKKDILKALELISIKHYSTKEASLETGIGKATLVSILANNSHTWILREYGQLLDSAKTCLIDTNKNIWYNIPKNRLTVKAKDIKYPKIISPEGKVYIVDNINEFARINGTISKSSLHRLLSGQVSKTKGWKVCQEEPV